MYLEYFGLLEPPFSIAPDPRYLYMSEHHREALAHLLYGMESDGAFILLTGEVGTGKTTVSRCLLEQVPDDTNLALVLNPKLNSIELLQVICDELRIVYNESELSVKSLVDFINRYLLGAHAQGKKTVVLIEEAQNLDLDVLEQLRLLTNLETSERKLLQVILLGQPEFLEVLDRPELSQLAQRITARFHLTPLNFHEVEEYIGHRLAIAGCRRPLFSAGVIKQLYKYSGGVPRLINVICDRALLGCYVQNKHLVDKKTLTQAAKEVLGETKAAANKARRFPYWPKIFSVAMLSCLLLVSVVYLVGFETDSTSVSSIESENVSKESISTEETLKSNVEIKEALSEEAEETVTEEPVAEEVVAGQVTNKESVESYIQWPEDDQRLRSNLQAFQALFKRWHISYRVLTDGTPCFFATTQGLSCLHDESDIEHLRKLNRPAVLKLYDDFNQSQYITLVELGSDTARIHIAGKQQTISLDQLLFYWKGEFSLLWRIPPGYQDLIRPGNAGETVVWLSEMMNIIDDKPEKSASSFYDSELVNQVKDFQQRKGLDSDGVVGVRTLIHINHTMRQNAPVLESSS